MPKETGSPRKLLPTSTPEGLSSVKTLLVFGKVPASSKGVSTHLTQEGFRLYLGFSTGSTLSNLIMYYAYNMKYHLEKNIQLIIYYALK